MTSLNQKEEALANSKHDIHNLKASAFKGFTLAEVLITLAIIGVVVALTIPTVITNYRNRELATRLKKVYSTLCNTTNFAIKDNGPVSGWNVGSQSANSSKNFANKYLIPYLNVSKNCGPYGDNDTTCNRKTVSLKGQELFYFTHPHSSFYLNDGTHIGVITSTSALNAEAEIFVDVNGIKGPNIRGVDVFQFKYSLAQNGKPSGKFFPIGNKTLKSNITDSRGCQKGSTGQYCTKLIMMNNWTIPSKNEYVKMGGSAENYPW